MVRSWKDWRQCCALGLGGAYIFVVFFAALCSTTTLLLSDTPYPTHHDTQYDTHHQPTPSEAQPASTLLDTCACVLQGLMPTTLPIVFLPSWALPIEMAHYPQPLDLHGLLSFAQSSIRAPPIAHS